MNRSHVAWSAWCVATLAWTAALTLPINAPVFGATEEMRTLTRLILSKGAHLSIYAAWAFVTGWLQPRVKVRIFLLIFLMAHGVGTEWCQLLTYDILGRHGSLRDAALDQLGILVGVIAGYRYWTAPDTPQAHL
jgi:hypothetical protein